MKQINNIILILFLFAFNLVLFAEEKPKEWSEYQGKLSWKNAGTKCESLGMRLPTPSEFKKAYVQGLTRAWEEKGDYYWTAYAMFSYDDRICFNVNSGEHSLSYMYTYKHMRCVR